MQDVGVILESERAAVVNELGGLRPEEWSHERRVAQRRNGQRLKEDTGEASFWLGLSKRNGVSASRAWRVLRGLDKGRTPKMVRVTVAHERAWLFKSILHTIAQSLGRRIVLLPVPWRFMWAGLRVT